MSAVWTPSREWIERTSVGRFMRRLGFKPYRQVQDASRGPEWARSFVGGRLDIAHNCLDRWAESGRVACIREGESGETRSIAFGELRDEANRVANGLVARGLAPTRG